MSKSQIKEAFAAVKAEYENGTRESAEFTAFVNSKKEIALAALSELKTALDYEMACAPSDEALRAIKTFSFRTAAGIMSRETCATEFYRLVNRYGENYSAYMAFHDMAARSGAGQLAKPVIAFKAEQMEEASKTIELFFDAADILTRGGVSAERAAEFDSAMDQYIQVE